MTEANEAQVLYDLMKTLRGDDLLRLVELFAQAQEEREKAAR